MRNKVLLLSFVLFSSLANSKTSIHNNLKTDNKLPDGNQNNTCLYDVRNRSLNTSTYVKEMVILDFDNTGILGESVGYKGAELRDDGQGYDLRGGDGVYTTTQTYVHDDANPFESVGRPISILEKPILHQGFNKTEKLFEFARTYQIRDDHSGDPAGLMNFECDIEFGTCGGCLFSTTGVCECCCITISNCHWTIGFGI